MKVYISPEKNKWASISKRPKLDFANTEDLNKKVFGNVRKKGNQALLDYTKKFDGIEINNLQMDSRQLNTAAGAIDSSLKKAIDVAYSNIVKFHKQLDIVRPKVRIDEGIDCWAEAIPIEKVGLYVPGGSAPLISTVLMLGIPAQLAGCDEVVLCTPPDKNGSINPAICYAAQKTGITKVYSIGGIQAIAAMAFGTKTIPKVDKIFGPGNQYVTAAKKYAQNFGVAIDMPAGPSEVMVIADETARADYVAADLLSQAEHGPDSQVVLLTDSPDLASAVSNEVKRQLKNLPRRNIAAQSIKKSFICVMELKDAFEFANEYAPEHLILNVLKPKSYLKNIKNAGSVFLGQYSPESAGDYASGTNHTLPTAGWAKAYSGLSVRDFQKNISYQRLTKKGLTNLSRTITTLAYAEGLDAHAKAVEIRVNKV